MQCFISCGCGSEYGMEVVMVDVDLVEGEFMERGKVDYVRGEVICFVEEVGQFGVEVEGKVVGLVVGMGGVEGVQMVGGVGGGLEEGRRD